MERRCRLLQNVSDSERWVPWSRPVILAPADHKTTPSGKLGSTSFSLKHNEFDSFMATPEPDPDDAVISQPVESAVQITALTRAFSRINSTATDTVSAEYNGKAMTHKQARGLTVLLDEFKFVVESEGGHQDVEILAEFNKLPISTTRPQLNPRAGYVRFYAGVMYKYTVEEYRPSLPFIMVEQTLVDMKRKVSANGTPVTKYGTGWINVAIPLPASINENKEKSRHCFFTLYVKEWDGKNG